MGWFFGNTLRKNLVLFVTQCNTILRVNVLSFETIISYKTTYE